MCGVVGAAARPGVDVFDEVFEKMKLLQHRGPQGCGIAISDGKTIRVHHAIGLVRPAFNDGRMQRLGYLRKGHLGIGHTLYSTIGQSGQKKQPKAFHPMRARFCGIDFVLAHNGNVFDWEGELRNLRRAGYIPREHSDTSVIVGMIATSKANSFPDAVKEVVLRLRGGFALVILWQNKLIGVRDRFGLRPLCLGFNYLNRSWVLASEDWAFRPDTTEFVSEIQPGEIIIIGEDGVEERSLWAEDACCKECPLERIYFAHYRTKHPDVYSHRYLSGESLAQESPVNKDVVVLPVPDSGIVSGKAFTRKLGCLQEEWIIRDRYNTDKTFLADRATNRSLIQNDKLFVLRDEVRGQKVCAVEDSLIRGSVSGWLMSELRRAALEVHFRIASPPIWKPCYYGIDFPEEAALITYGRTLEQITKKLGVDSCAYLSLRAMIRASGKKREELCLGCFTGEYPVKPFNA